MSRPPSRRHLFTTAAVLALTLVTTAPARAEEPWPAKPIKLVVGFPAGGPTDTAARILAEKLSEQLRQPVVVENKAGASGTLAASGVAKAPKDGHTWMMMATPTLLAPHLYGPRDVDLQKDFAAVASIYDLPILLVVNPTSLPDVTSLPALVARAKADGGKLNYTSSGNGSFGHISTEQLKAEGRFDMQHVPYKGSAPAVADVLGGQVPVMFADLVSVLPHVKAGKLRAVAIGSAERLPALPDLKSVAEQGFKGFDATSWGGLVVPTGTPREVIDRLAEEIRRALADKAVQQRLEAAGCYANWQGPAKMAERMRSDYDRWGRVVRERQIKME